MIWVSMAILIAQIVIAIVSYFTVYRHRSIYAIKTKVFRLPKGNKFDTETLRTEDIDNILKDGKYTVLYFAVRDDRDLQVILGKIKE